MIGASAWQQDGPGAERRWSRRSRATARSTSARCGGWRGGRSTPASTSSCPAARPARARRCPTTSACASSSWSSRRRRARCRCWPAPAATTRAKSSSSALRMKRAGADGILSVTPYYNKPTPEGLFQHYSAIAGEVGLPIVVYNVPGRTGCNVEVATLVRLSAVPNIVGVKEASGNMSQMCEICSAVPGRLPRAVGRRCADAAADGGRRARDHLGGLERGAGGDGADGRAPPSAATSPRRAGSTPSCCR